MKLQLILSKRGVGTPWLTLTCSMEATNYAG